MKKIWLVNHYAVSPDLPGGTRHFDFARELVKMGYDISIFAADFSCHLKSHQKIAGNRRYSEEKIAGVLFIWLKVANYRENNWRRVFSMLTFSLNLFWAGLRREKPDVIIGSTPHLFAALTAYFLSKIKKDKFILEIRDLWPQVMIDMGNASEKNLSVKTLRVIESYLYAKADKIVILAKGTKDYLIKHRIDENKIYFIPNGVSLESFRPSLGREAARQKYGFSKFTLVYTGAHGPANDLFTILKAAERLKADNRIELILLGDGPEKVRLKAFAAENRLANIRFMELIPKFEMPDFLLAADAGIITLKGINLFSYGVSPNKLFDYMVCSLPVICAVEGEMGIMVEIAKAGISIPPESPELLEKAIVKLYNMTAVERESMGQSGYSYIVKNHLREKQVRQLAELF